MESKIGTFLKQDYSKDIRGSIVNDDLLMKRREEIVLKSSRVFLTKGYDRTSIRELAKALGMTTGGLYRYIGSKDDILSMILEYMDFQKNYLDYIASITDKLSPVEALKMGIERYYKAVDERHTMYNFLNHVMVNLSPEGRKKVVDSELRTIAYYEDIIKRGMDSGVFIVEDPSYLAHLIVFTGHGWANRSWFLKDKYTIEEYIQKTTDLVLKQLLAPKSEFIETIL
jgi:AcrR family transcriptional regulator